MKNRPILEIESTMSEKVFNLFAILILLSMILYLMSQWGALPANVPAHYNAQGEVDRWGNKGELTITPIFALVIWISTTIFERFPHLINYGTGTRINVKSLYQNSKKAVNFVKNEVTLLFSFLIWNDVHVAKGHPSKLSFLFITFIAIVLFATIFFFIRRTSKLKQCHLQLVELKKK